MVGGGVLARGVVAAADVAAGLAHPQVDPAHPHRQTLLAALDLVREVEVGDRLQMGTGGVHKSQDIPKTDRRTITKGFLFKKRGATGGQEPVAISAGSPPGIQCASTGGASSRRERSASSAPMQPVPAAGTAWR